jgi:hypothetical protein
VRDKNFGFLCAEARTATFFQASKNDLNQTKQERRKRKDQA